MVVIRRELPRTRVAGLATGAGRIVSLEGSPLRVPLDRCPACLIVFAPSPGEVVYAARRRQAASWRPLRSAVTPIDQMKPSSSRPTAVTTCCLFLPLASSTR